MQPQTTLTVAQVILQVTKQVGEMTAFISLITSFATEAVKNWGLPSKWAFPFSFIGGFGLSVLVNGIVFGSYFSPIAILTGIFAGAVASGFYSGIKAINTSGDQSTQTQAASQNAAASTTTV